MSYCRVSSDGWRSDLYCYGDGSHYITHVSHCRSKGRIAQDLDERYFSYDEVEAVEQQQMLDLQKCKKVKIKLPHAGKTFMDKTPQQFLDRLFWLKKIGYHVPDSAIVRIAGEMYDDRQKKRRKRS